MKKIAIVINALKTGGVTTSLKNLLNEIHGQYDITLIIFGWEEDYKKLLPENVKVMVVKSPFKYFGYSFGECKKCKRLLPGRIFWTLAARVFGRSFVTKIMSLFQKKIGDFDYAISYLHEASQKQLYGGCNDFVLRNVTAKEKVAWIHGDYKTCGANTKQSKKLYQKFDKIVACSEGAKNSFVECLPELSNKTYVIKNCNDYQKIYNGAKESVEYDKDYFNVITVARISREKGIERALKAVKNCIDKGYKIKYHVVGAGPLENELKELCKEMDISDNVVFYGRQENPYKYVKNADLFLLPSYHEAAPMVIDEAHALGVPVLTTNTTSAKEMVEEVGGGFVCENSTEGVCACLEKVVANREELKNIKNNLSEKNYNNDAQKQDFKNLIV